MTKINWPKEIDVRREQGNSRSFELGYNKGLADAIEAERKWRMEGKKRKSEYKLHNEG